MRQQDGVFHEATVAQGLLDRSYLRPEEPRRRLRLLPTVEPVVHDHLAVAQASIFAAEQPEVHVVVAGEADMGAKTTDALQCSRLYMHCEKDGVVPRATSRPEDHPTSGRF